MRLQHFAQQFFTARLWGFIGVLLAIVFGIITLLSTLDQSKTSILFEIVNESNVLDVRQPLTDLQILFRGEELQEKNLNLRKFSLRLENNGDSDILQNHFDRNDIWGFTVSNGDVIEIRLTGSNSQYIENNLNPQETEENVVQFNKVIFESGKFFTLEMFVLHSKDLVPSIRPIGKIAGIERVDPIIRTVTEEKPSFVTQFLQGSIFIHTLRAVLYVGAAIILVYILTIATFGLGALFSLPGKQSRRKAITATVHLSGLNSENWSEAVVESYAENGKASLLELKHLLSQELMLVFQVSAMDTLQRSIAIEPSLKDTLLTPYDKTSHLLLALMDAGAIKYDKSSTEVIIAPKFEDDFSSVLEALNI